MPPTLLICIGPSGTGKTTYIKKNLIKEGLFHLIRSYTTRPLRDGEVEGFPYTVKRNSFFRRRHRGKKHERKLKKLVVHIFANKSTYETDGKEWHYGVTKKEIDKYAKEGRHLVYDVIQPCYAKTLIDYINKEYPLQYNIKVAWFVPPENDDNVVAKRENMLNGIEVRKKNGCTINDILNAGIHVDYTLCPKKDQFCQLMTDYVTRLYDDMMRTKEKTYGLVDIPERNRAA